MATHCSECGTTAQSLRRDRCRRCYRSHVKALKDEGNFVSLVAGRVSRPVGERLLDRIEEAPNGCWLYSGQISDQGYGRITDEIGRTVSAHRVSYAYHCGPIPAGFQIDHQCHNSDVECAAGPRCLHRRCVNPAHLRLATPRVNILSGRTVAAQNAAKTHCAQGHEYTQENTRLHANGGRVCLACRQTYWSKYRPKTGLTPAMTHGKRSTYTRGGCRCEPCKAAERAHGIAKRAAARSAEPST